MIYIASSRSGSLPIVKAPKEIGTFTPREPDSFRMACSTCLPGHGSLGSTTDDLGPTLSTVFIAVVGFYFGQAAVKEIANMIRPRK